MSEEEITSQSEQPAEAAPEPSSPSLDDIAGEFSVEEQVNQFQAQPQPQAQPDQAPYVPDPIVDPDGWQRMQTEQSQQFNQVNQTLQSLAGKVETYEKQAAQQQVDAKVNDAVSKINKKLNVDPTLAEIALEKMYRDDPNFKKIWDNQDQNKGAFDKALDVVADKYAGIFNTKSDPQLLENQRAASSSQRTMQTTRDRGPDEDWSGLSESEFDLKWRNELQG